MLLEELNRLFARATSEGFMDTAQTLTQPSVISRQIAVQAIPSVDLTPVLQDLGTIVAQRVANDLESMGLRPADYADLPDLPQAMSILLIQALKKTPTEFADSFLNQLKLRG